MFNKLLSIVIVVGSLVIVPVHNYAAEPHATHQVIELTPDTLNLLRSEMKEIAGGMQAMSFSIATADWKSVQAISAKIRTSYIMEQKLTSSQKKELGRALPEHFKLLDAEFHQRAEKLGIAAAAHDSELTVFHYSRLVESCVRCHSAYASKRFPGFAAPTPKSHHH